MVKGDGSKWIVHHIGFNSPPPEDFQPYFAFDATHSAVCDLNVNGKNEIIFWITKSRGEGLGGWRTSMGRESTGSATRYSRRVRIRRGAYHALYIGDLDDEGDIDIFTCEMEGGQSGNAPDAVFAEENQVGMGPHQNL